jgi:galactokinase
MLVDIPPARLAAITTTLPAVLARRVKHVVNENQRTIMAAQALRRGDDAALGLLVNASHDSLRDLYECSTPRLDRIVEYARGIPRALGARLVGAGWGGSVLVIAEQGAGGVVAHALEHSSLGLPSVRLIVPGPGAMAG